MLLRRFASILATCCLVGLSPLAAFADTDPAKIAASEEALQKFLSEAEGSAESGEPPRASDPETAALLDDILDISALGDETLDLDEISATAPLMVNGTKVLFVYMLAGTGLEDMSQLASDPAAAERANANMVEYAPEIGAIYDYTARMQGAFAEGVADFLEGASAEQVAAMQGGLDQMRGGIVQSVGGILQGVSLPDYSLDWRRERSDVLIEIAPQIVEFLSPEQAAQLAEEASTYADAVDNPEVKSDLERFAELMQQ